MDRRIPPNLLTFVNVQDYLVRLVPERPGPLAAMEAEAERTGFPIIGPAAGYQCYQLARIVGARRVFEMGSGFGYSTAWFARAVVENGGGEVHHVVWDENLSVRARISMEELGFKETVRYHVAEAVQTLRETKGPFDLIFNDIDKEAYPESLPLIREKLRSGGLLLVDNLLWDGRIFDPGDRSPSTQAIRDFTKAVTTDPAWIATVLPIRDGLLAAWKL